MQLNGIHIGHILGMVVSMTDGDTPLLTDRQSETLSLSILLSIFVLMIVLFAAFLLMFVVFLCRGHVRRPSAYQVAYLCLLSG